MTQPGDQGPGVQYTGAVERGRLSLNAGVEIAPLPGSGADLPQSRSAWVGGAQWQLTDKARVSLQSTVSTRPETALPEANRVTAFRAAPSTLQMIGRGTLLRMDINGRSNVSLQVRSKGVGVMFKKTF